MIAKPDISPVGAAARRYKRRYALAMIAYAASLALVIYLFRNAPPPPLLRYPLAILPALPILAVVWALGRFLVEETDEVVRARMVQQLLWGSAITLSVSTLWGFLEAFAAAPHLRAYWVFPLFCVGLMASLPFVRRKYS